jgi:hypothetical protein
MIKMGSYLYTNELAERPLAGEIEGWNSGTPLPPFGCKFGIRLELALDLDFFDSQ